MFGIEAINSTGLKLRFRLYPKNLTDQVFCDSRVTTVNGTTSVFEVVYEIQVEQFGRCTHIASISLKYIILELCIEIRVVTKLKLFSAGLLELNNEFIGAGLRMSVDDTCSEVISQLLAYRSVFKELDNAQHVKCTSGEKCNFITDNRIH